MPFALALFAALGLGPVPASADPRPNVIVILTDDQGSVDLGCYGARDLHTPHLDALARRGVRFTQFLAAAPVCSPSRAGLLTGRYPLRAGVPDNVGSNPGAAGMPPSEVTMAEVFRAAGYSTAHVGKWHLGYSPATMPNAQGFDRSFGHMGGCIDNYSHFFYWAGPNRHDLWRDGKEAQSPGRYFTDLITDEAASFVEAHRDRPFFLYFAVNAPHYPYQGEPAELDRHASLPYPRSLYAAFVSSLDARVGRLLAKVESLGLSERTVVVFQSDHGHSTEERAHFGGGSAGPYRGAKFSLFEGGLRVPAIVSWPGHLPENQVRGQLAHGCDWLPTLVELCGIKGPDRPIDGLSLVEVIRNNAASPHQVTHWQVGRGPNAQWAVRRGDWKLIGNPRDTGRPGTTVALDRLFLSDLKDDVAESKNHATERSDLVRELQAAHDRWLEAVGKEAAR